MGTANSKSPGMKKSGSSSAAFGRIRIDSPDVASPARRRLKQRRQQLGSADALGASPIIGRDGLIRPTSSFNSFPKTEASPLLMPPQQQRQLGKHSADTAAGMGSDDYGFLTNISPGSSPGHHHKQDTIKAATQDAPMGSPPLIVWIGPALFCALCYALYNIFIKVRTYAAK